MTGGSCEAAKVPVQFEIKKLEQVAAALFGMDEDRQAEPFGFCVTLIVEPNFLVGGFLTDY
jgi:hypothetical protein